jgi:tetratricopeptide (TPR) repeat protein
VAKPRVFIGSSAESLRVAEALQVALEYEAETVVWSQGIFELMQTSMETLEEVLSSFDFALFVFTPDDVTHTRGADKATVRDNVVFELGLFLGRLGRDRTVIVSPRGVDLHLPTDLLGVTPATYEPKRQDENLDAAVGPTATKVKRLMAKKGTLPRTVAVQTMPTADQPEEPLPPDFYVPRPDWSQADFDRAIFFAIHQDKKREADEIEAAFRKSDLASAQGALELWQATQEYRRLRFNKGGSVEAVRSLVEANPQDGRLHQMLGLALGHYDDHPGALAEHLEAARLARSTAAATSAIRSAIAASKKAGKSLNADALLATLFSKERQPDDEDAVLQILDAIAQLDDLGEVALAIAERRTKLAPDDTGMRFDLAFRHSGAGHHELSLLHYDAVPVAERGAGVWNNLGVAYSHLRMPGRAVSAYKRAWHDGDSIAASNMADKLRTAGFFELADEMAEAAMKVPDYAPNVVSSLEALRVARNDEEQADSEARLKARDQQQFLGLVGEAAARLPQEDLSGAWDVGPCAVVLRRDGSGKWAGSGQYEEK